MPIDMAKFASFSFYGEDAMLFGLFDRLNNMANRNLFESATYIDVGCYHPVYDSNTYFLYHGGWRGTLVDPNPVIAAEVEKYRDKDLFLEVGVSSTPETRDLFMFSDANSGNTMSADFAARVIADNGREIARKVSVECVTLDSVVESHIKFFRKVPVFLDLDVEGMDFEVISSYSFEYRIPFIMIEDEILGAFEGSEIREFMATKDYAPVTSNFLSTIYLDTRSEFFPLLRRLGAKKDA